MDSCPSDFLLWLWLGTPALGVLIDVPNLVDGYGLLGLMTLFMCIVLGQIKSKLCVV